MRASDRMAGVGLALLATAAPLRAQEVADDGALRERVTALEEELAEVRGLLAEPAADERPGFRVGPNLRAQLYGYVKLDAAYDSARVSTGNFARWVESEETNSEDDLFSLTERESRFGLLLENAQDAELRTSGRVEIDFYGSGTENKPEPYLRHAYMTLAWPDCGWEVLAGQNWDVVSPLVAPTVNYTVAWWQGNVGYRRPQLRVTRRLALGEGERLELAVAAARTVSNRQTPFAPSSGDTGSDAGFPTMQARVGWTFPALGGRAATVGLSGHYGEEEFDLDAGGTSMTFRSWSLCLDAKVPVTDELLLQAELFTGEDLDAYLGGIGQGVDATLGREIAASGGWLAASWTPSDVWTFHLGGAIDRADEDDLSAASARESNSVVFANAWRALDDNASAAFELSRLETDYVGVESGDSVRAQFALVYRF